MKPSAYYEILENYILSIENISDKQKDKLLEELDVLFLAQIVKFLELNLPSKLIESLYKDIDRISGGGGAPNESLERIIYNYFQKVPNRRITFQYFVEQQSIKTLVELLKNGK